MNPLISLAFQLVSLAQEAPHLTVLPTGSVIRRDLGTTGFFTCRVSQQHEQLVDDVVWLDPRGQEVPDERQNRPGAQPPRLYSSDASSGKGRELFVSNITENDSGNYTCKARYGTNQEITKTFALLVYMSIRWEDAPQRQNPVMGSRALIRCVARASPPAIVEWFRGSQLISGGGRYTTQDDGLVIENITSEDDGVYLCRAKVPAEGELDERRITVEWHVSNERLKHKRWLLDMDSHGPVT
ncbi:fasciclin-2-like [Pollicipes pollicipes]|uniref:fasciclin-2-like n=1 Tax=Pollicipes pollicipes TaxID=41117 RepID=UPI001884DD19|nr:fasciclin-2-like [Pollicipes pollicipes]